MTPEDWAKVKADYPNWQDATLHDLRLRFVATMLAIRMHERAIRTDGEVQVCPADEELWDIPTQEGF